MSRSDVRRALLCAHLCVLPAAHAAAQTDDSAFGGWRWAPEGPGSRPAGMGGAYVAVADSVQAMVANPAGLTQIPATEVSLSSGPLWAGAARNRSRKLRLGAYLTRTDVRQVEHEDGLARIESSVREAGLGIGAGPFGRLRLGATVSWSSLRLRGESSRDEPSGGEASRTTLEGDDGHVRLTTGLLIDLARRKGSVVPRLRFGLAYQPGFDWSVARTTRTGSGPASSRSIGVRRPSTVTAGLAWSAPGRWSFMAEGDLIRYREVFESLRGNIGEGAAGFGLPDTVEPRLGMEFATPLSCGCGVVKLRAGIHYRSPGTLRYAGGDPLRARAFPPGRWRSVAALGGSFFAQYFRNALRLDVDARDVFEGPELSFGLVWRF